MMARLTLFALLFVSACEDMAPESDCGVAGDVLDQTTEEVSQQLEGAEVEAVGAMTAFTTVDEAGQILEGKSRIYEALLADGSQANYEISCVHSGCYGEECVSQGCDPLNNGTSCSGAKCVDADKECSSQRPKCSMKKTVKYKGE